MSDPVVLLSTGDVVGPAGGVTDNSMVLFSGTSGKLIKGNNAVVTTQGLALLDDVDATANRATIGLNQVNNTSDLNKPVSIPQQVYIQEAVGTGAVQMFARATAPPGWLKTNGAAISRTTYAALFAAIGTVFGAGDGSTTFNLPDLRGEFLRSWDDARGIDNSRSFGSWQGGANESHAHTATATTDAHTHTWSGTTSNAGNHQHDLATDTGGSSNLHTVSSTSNSDEKPTGALTGVAGAHTHTVSGTTSIDSHSHIVTVTMQGAEARPRNIALLTCIKY